MMQLYLVDRSEPGDFYAITSYMLQFGFYQFTAFNEWSFLHLDPVPSVAAPVTRMQKTWLYAPSIAL